MKWSIVILFITLLIVPSVAADRPEYSFSDDVFKELEPFPDDFFEIMDLFATQAITAKQLGVSYYQPELIPGWDYWSERVYTPGSDTFGSYGVFVYPSHFTAHDVREGDFFNISMFIYASWGIQKYQGVKLSYDCPQGVSLNFITPDENNNILLYPTAPHFHSGWLQLIEAEIYVSEPSNCTIKIYEVLPDDNYELIWKDHYDYISGGSLISQRVPKCTISLYGKSIQKLDEPEIEDDEELSQPPFDYTLVLVLIIIAVLMICVRIIYAKRKTK